MKGLGANISKWRRRRLMTQAELANKLGVHTNTVGSYEIDRREPSLDVLVKIADILHVSVNCLLNLHSDNSYTDLVNELLHAKEYLPDIDDNGQMQFFIRLLEEAGYTIKERDNGILEITTSSVNAKLNSHDFIHQEPRLFVLKKSSIPLCVVLGLQLGAAFLADLVNRLQHQHTADADPADADPVKNDKEDE